MCRTAVVILNWNGSRLLRQYLPSVVQHSSGEAHVYVADNGSTDDSVDILQRQFPQVDIIRLDCNYGYAEGYNRALQHVTEQYAVLLNSDVEVTPHWLTPMTDYMDAHPEVSACQPKILSWRDRSSFEYAGACGGYMDRYGYPFCRGRILGTVEKDGGQYDDTVQVFWATGAAMMVRTADYRSAGGLDAGFFAHMEEIDLCWRLRARGHGVACIPASVVYHLGAATLAKENPRKTFLNFRNNLLMLYKNLPDAEYCRVMSVRCILDYVAALSFLVRGQVSNAVAVVKARREYAALKSRYRAARVENLSLAVSDDVPCRTHFSIIVAYYLKGKKKYSEL